MICAYCIDLGANFSPERGEAVSYKNEGNVLSVKLLCNYLSLVLTMRRLHFCGMLEYDENHERVPARHCVTAVNETVEMKVET